MKKGKIIRKGPAPAFWVGDSVVITNRTGDLSQKLDGLEAQVVENVGRRQRKKGSKITSGSYRVYIPELDSYRTLKSSNLILTRPFESDAPRWGSSDQSWKKIERSYQE